MVQNQSIQDIKNLISEISETEIQLLKSVSEDFSELIELVMYLKTCDTLMKEGFVDIEGSYSRVAYLLEKFNYYKNG